MLITFLSSADADVIMFGEVGQQMLVVMGKDPQALEGIVPLEQLPSALVALQRAVQQDRLAQRQSAADEDEEEQDAKRSAIIHFAQRAVPLLDMLQRSIDEKTPVLWRVSGNKA